MEGMSKSDGNKTLGKWKEERLKEMKQEERDEELERRYTRHCRENMSRRKNNEDSAGRIEREED